ncbi:lysophospholipid acyltransferase family protein [Pseudobacteriovorax antillogorgiicola]|uniref:Acyltransferase n=1 Tax=Pseudobacteriovorax antillogorgiicola TaxID=1513793 RepID=A0A1Y6CIQ3_9BACT|nr:lysophospholipid acyltransferase family protein [Pseudobacteriovorax antillogorgiicola]TCS46730.1 acyltransferase-like protein [Pseudobacteriovorax antillogorgiicola]SMF67190.1 Acyltransferase [Pseudobacteriovorax antillogorgiicola]
MQEELQLKLLPITLGLRLYHRHEVHGLENIPASGPVIIACNHSLATYDISLLMSAVYQKLHRFPRALIDRAFYRIPGLGELMEKLGCIVGSQENAQSLLSNGEILYLAPGGMQESLRPSTDRYRVLWTKRKGFAKLAIDSGAPVILAACPKADDIFTVYENGVTDWIYRNFKMPFFLARGLGPTVMPKPVKLDHYLSRAFYPPKKNHDPVAYKRQVYNFHRKLVQEMNRMIDEGVIPSDQLPPYE